MLLPRLAAADEVGALHGGLFLRGDHRGSRWHIVPRDNQIILGSLNS